MKIRFTDNTSVRKILLAFAVWLLPVLSLVCQAGELEESSHALIERFIDGNTVLVGWVDLSQIDLDEMEIFAADVDLGHLPTIPQQVRGIRATLVELNVTRVYWISSLSDLFGGPRAFLIPASESRTDTVALLLRSATSDGQSVVVDGSVVLAGDNSTIATLQKSSGAPLQYLVNALAQSNSPNGIVAGASTDSLRTASGLLGSLTPSDSGFLTTLGQLLPELKSAALHGYLPPTAATLQIETTSDEAASKLAALLNAKSAELLEGDASSIKLSFSGSTVTIRKSSFEALTESIRSLVKLLQPARYRANHELVMNNLKQLALGMHNFHDHHARFPPQRLVDEKGKPLHSWRVLILPYLGGGQLYNQFRLDEPWDSEHNIKLTAQMPDVFRSPDDSAEMTAVGKTRFVAPLSDNSMFGHRGDSARIRDITDGTSNTLMVVQAATKNAVIWTKPDDLVLSQDRPLFEQIAGDADGFTACSCDGVAHYLNRNVTEEAMRSLVSMDGGEIVEWP
jgi:hypothetical protein